MNLTGSDESAIFILDCVKKEERWWLQQFSEQYNIGPRGTLVNVVWEHVTHRFFAAFGRNIGDSIMANYSLN